MIVSILVYVKPKCNTELLDRMIQFIIADLYNNKYNLARKL